MIRSLNIAMLLRRIFILLLLLITGLSAQSQQYVADFAVAKENVLREIPIEYINKARNELVVAYQHTSHGTHVSRGVFGLPDYKTGDEQLFGVSSSSSEGKLDFRDYALQSYAPEGVDGTDLSHNETAFIQTTRNFLDASENADVNVVMWSWCDITGHDAAGNYLPGMSSLISEYGPGGSMIGTGAGQRDLPVDFIFMTGHANLNANAGTLQPKPQSELIASYCMANAQYCLDYYSIDSHDMNDGYWEDVGDDGNSSSYGGNFYVEWQNAHILGTDFYQNKETPGGSVVFGAHNSQHITANRKAFAFWWILARIAGWSGTASEIPVDEINVSAVGGANDMLRGENLQLLAEVLPVNANNKDISWNVTNQTGSATITQAGLLTATSAGTVVVVASAQDGSGVSGSAQVTISDPQVPVTSILVSSRGQSLLTTGESLQLDIEVLPSYATSKDVTWAVVNQTGTASVTQAGLLSGVSSGTIMVVATAKDGSDVEGSLLLTIVDSEVLVSALTLSAAGGVSEMLIGEVLQFSAEIDPSDATNNSIVWSVSNQSGSATISASGLLLAVTAGTVSIVAAAQDGSGVTGSLIITITEPEVPVSSIQVNSEGEVSSLNTGESLQFFAEILPANASSGEIVWSVSDETGSASITPGGLLTANSSGRILVIASALDGSGIKGSMVLNIINQGIPVSSLQMGSVGGSGNIIIGRTMQFIATILPANATNKEILWSVTDESGSASITQAGLLTALAAGTVKVTATSMDVDGMAVSKTVTITSPEMPVSSVQIIPENGISQIYTGQSLKLSVNVLPLNASNPDVRWDVWNDDGQGVVSPDGLFTAIREGSVRVIACAIDGSGVTDTLKVTIEDSVVITAIEIILENGGTSVPEGSEVKCLVEIEPESASDQGVTWTVQNISGAASISYDGYLSAQSKGLVKVIATPCTCFGLADTLEVEITSPVSIYEDGGEALKNMTLFPNPGKGSIFLDAGGLSITFVEVLDMGGQIVKQLNSTEESLLISIDMNGFPAACYFLRVHSEEGIAYRKMIIY